MVTGVSEIQTVCGRPPGPGIFLLGADSPAELVEQIDRLSDRIARAPIALRTIARTHGRRPWRWYRAAIVAESAGELAARLARARDHVRRAADRRYRDRSGLHIGSGRLDGRLAVMFPGQGSQYPAMTRELRLFVPGFRQWFDALDDAYVRGGAARPSDLLDQGERSSSGERLFGLETGAQLGLSASLALYTCLLALGVRADCFVGHSNGEHAALLAGGVLSFPSLAATTQVMCDVALASARLPPPRIPERVIAVTGLSAGAVEEIAAGLGGRAFVAVDNCPTQCVIAGSREAADELAAAIGARGAICSPLPFARAHHTPLFRDWSNLLLEHYRRAPIRSGPSHVYSCLTLEEYPRTREAIGQLLTDQWSARVRFRETILAMYASGVRTFVEAGPDAKLCAFVDDTLRGRPHRAVSASSSARGDFLQLAHCAAELYAAGVPIQPAVLDGAPVPPLDPRWTDLAAGPPQGIGRPGEPRATAAAAIASEYRATIELATAGQQRATDRMGTTAGRAAPRPRSDAGVDRGPLVGRVTHRDRRTLRAERRLTVETDPYLIDHSLARADREPAAPLAVVPFTMMMEMAVESACCLTRHRVMALSSMRAHRWLALDRGSLTVGIEAERRDAPADETLVDVRLVDTAKGETAFETRVHLTAGPPVRAPRRASAAPQGPAGRWSAAAFYRDYAFHGPSFRGVHRIAHVGPHGVAADLTIAPLRGLAREALQLDFALLDCAGQLAALWRLEHTGERVGVFPFAARELRVSNGLFQPQAPVSCRGTVRPGALDTLSSTFEFVDADGRALATLDGLEQRVLALPARLWEAIFGDHARGPQLSDPAPDALGRGSATCRLSDWDVLSRQGLIWARALAHLALAGDELARWYDTADGADRIRSLMTHAAAKEAVLRHRALAGAMPLEARAIRLRDQGAGRWAATDGAAEYPLVATVTPDSVHVVCTATAAGHVTG